MGNFWDQVISDLNSGVTIKKTAIIKKIRIRYYINNSYLTSREYDCLQLIKAGLTMKETGAKLKLSPRTVEFYLQNAKQRFALKKTKDLIKIIQTYPIKKEKT